ncbi:MAG: OmpA family protein [Candidatus Latescibacteria bacterium]|nr:OmpA family protein [Candidatus Latescibacterota bacterium]
MNKITIITCILIMFLFCTKKVTTVVYEDKPQKKAFMVFKPEEKPSQVEPPSKPMEVYRKKIVIYFKFDSDELTEKEKLKINNIDNPVELIGGACPLGNDDYNYTLGLKRAYSVKKIFDDRGIKVLSVKSIGEHDLITDEPKEYYLNRRCEVKY